MGSTIYLLLEARLKAECPDDVLAYLRSLQAGAELSEADKTSVAALKDRHYSLGSLPDSSWIVAPRSSVSLTEGKSEHRLAISGAFHDEFTECKYALVALVAEHAEDGPFCMTWTDLVTTSATVFMAHDGVAFRSVDNGTFKALSFERPELAPPVDFMVSNIPTDFFLKHGLNEAQDLQLREADPHDPVVAKYLLVRSLRRAVSDVLTDEASVERVIRQIVEVLDDGSDSLAAANSRGWQVVETSLRQRSTAHRTGRTLSNLSDVLSVVSHESSRTQPTQLEVGTEVIALTDFELDIVGLLRPLKVLVPARARLRISTVVHSSQHGLCQSPEWTSWDFSPLHGSFSADDDPLAAISDPTSCALRFIRLEDEGTLWRLA